MTLYTFPVPTKLNGEQLQSEIGAATLYVVDNKLVIESDKTEAQVETIIGEHVPVPKAELTVAQKLASVGLSVADLKEELGL